MSTRRFFGNRLPVVGQTNFRLNLLGIFVIAFFDKEAAYDTVLECLNSAVELGICCTADTKHLC